MRTGIVVLAALLATAAGCVGGSSGSAHTTRLTIVAHGINMATPWHLGWTLRCAPAGGTHPRPGAACAALHTLLADHAVPPRHCSSEISGPWTTVRGTNAGQPIHLAYAEACARDRRATLEAQALGMYFAHGGGTHPDQAPPGAAG